MLAELARPSDNDALLKLLRDNPMAGAITVGFERAPDYFAASGIGAEQSHVVVVRDPVSGCIACVGDVSVRRVFANGRSLRAAYVSNWRVDRAWRGQPDLLEQGLRCIADLQCDRLKADVFYSAIVADNAPARSRLERRRAGLAAFHRADELVTFLIRTRPRPRTAASAIAPATDRAELSAFLFENLARFQFATDWTGELSDRPGALGPEDFLLLRRNGRIAAAGATWDQRTAKQVFVHGYAPRLGRLRPLYNAVAAPTGRPSLPQPGSQLALASVAGFSVAGDDPAAAGALLDALRQSGVRERGIELLALTLSARHPAVPAIRKRFRPWTYRSLLYQIEMPGTLPPGQLQPDRMAQPEAGLL